MGAYTINVELHLPCASTGGTHCHLPIPWPEDHTIIHGRQKYTGKPQSRDYSDIYIHNVVEFR